MELVPFIVILVILGLLGFGISMMFNELREMRWGKKWAAYTVFYCPACRRLYTREGYVTRSCCPGCQASRIALRF